MKSKIWSAMVICLIVFMVSAIVLASLYLKSLNMLKGYNEEIWVHKLDLSDVADGEYQGLVNIGNKRADILMRVKNNQLTDLRIIESN